MRQLLNSFFDLVRIWIENHLVLRGFGCCVHKTTDCQYHMALQWLPITGFYDLCILVLNMTASHSQNLHNVISGSARAAPLAHYPLNSLGLCNRSDFNQTGRRQALSASLQTLLAVWMPPMAVPWPKQWFVFYNIWLCNGFPSLVSARLRMTFRFHILP